MADLFDMATHLFRRWASGCEHAARGLGVFNPDMPASEAWVRKDFAGKCVSYQLFDRGWNQARAAHKEACHG